MTTGFHPRSPFATASRRTLLFFCGVILVSSRRTVSAAFLTPKPVLPGISSRRISNEVPRLIHGLPSSSTSLNMLSLEDLMYSASSAASQWASLSLDADTHWVASFPIMYGAGLLTSFSPCVWSLLPITLSYISTAAGERDDQNTAVPTLAFAAGLATVFCSLGLFASSVGGAVLGSTASTGGMILAMLSNTIAILMGLQLLDVIRVPLPSLELAFPGPKTSIKQSSSEGPILIDGQGNILPIISPEEEEQKDSKKSNGGSLLRTFFLGGSSALIASPCSTPVLASILAFVAGDAGAVSSPVVGAALLLGYTLGYSTPLLLLAATGGQALVYIQNFHDSNTNGDNGDWYGLVAPWVSPALASILLFSGTNGLLTTLFGDPSLAALAPILE